jgi:hypothetical protein
MFEFLGITGYLLILNISKSSEYFCHIEFNQHFPKHDEYLEDIDGCGGTLDREIFM